MTTSSPGLTAARLSESIEKSTFGIIEMPELGDIYYMAPLGEQVLVYGQYGINILRLTDDGRGYGEIKFLPFGIKNRNLIAGNRIAHVFMAEDNSLWSVGRIPRTLVPDQDVRTSSGDGKEFTYNNIRVRNLGYEEHFSGVTDGNILLDAINARFYIVPSAGSITYILTQYGSE